MEYLELKDIFTFRQPTFHCIDRFGKLFEHHTTTND